jgi:hypothetical protein
MTAFWKSLQVSNRRFKVGNLGQFGQSGNLPGCFSFQEPNLQARKI